ncbi:hypothetical protein MKX01_005390 [Papaver californicum]|nr:hypothetical protein MKX01_005390 [Papaver californicum]
MYFKCGEISFATLLFDIMPQRNIVSWTAMITGFLQNRRSLEALKTFSLMRFAGEKPTQFAFSSVIQASTDVSSIVLSKQLHSLTVKSGVTIELFVGSNLADMYAKCGFLNDACKIFDEMPFKDEVTWTSMIDGYTKNGNFDEAFCTFKSMVDEGIAIDQHVFCSTLGACAALENLKLGKSLHSCIVKGGFVSDVIVGNALTDLYAKSGDMESASSLLGFDSEEPEPSRSPPVAAEFHNFGLVDNGLVMSDFLFFFFEMNLVVMLISWNVKKISFCASYDLLCGILRFGRTFLLGSAAKP